jgi:prepilin-type N-terminal cleavage/methylation domain-containing protein
MRSINRAFTLIELLVVIAIIAILAAILFPVFAQAKAAAKNAQTISNIKQLGLGVQLYIGDSDDVLRAALHSTGTVGPPGSATALSVAKAGIS